MVQAKGINAHCFSLQNPEILENILLKALVQDETQFVLALFDSGVDVKHFLTYERLKQLYADVCRVLDYDTV